MVGAAADFIEIDLLPAQLLDRRNSRSDNQVGLQVEQLADNGDLVIVRNAKDAV